jgi:hypothetical protein
MKPGMQCPRRWLVLCLWVLIVWALPAEASWETYQRAGEEAYSRGDYGTAQRMFMAAVREARHFGPQDPRLDMSLSKLALLRVVRGGTGHTARHHAEKARHTPASRTAKKVARHRRAHAPVRASVRQTTPRRQREAVRTVRSRGRRAEIRPRMAQDRHRVMRPRAQLRQERRTTRVAPAVRRPQRYEQLRRRVQRREQQRRPARSGLRWSARPERITPRPPRHARREAIHRVPRRRQERTLQRPRATLRRGAPQRATQSPRAVRPGHTRSAARRR